MERWNTAEARRWIWSIQIDTEEGTYFTSNGFGYVDELSESLIGETTPKKHRGNDDEGID